MVSNALVRSIKTTPFRRPLSMFTDQAFVASSKAVSVLCRERNPDWQPSSTTYLHKAILGEHCDYTPAAGARDDLKLDLSDLMESSSREDLKLLKRLSLRRNCWLRSLAISKRALIRRSCFVGACNSQISFITCSMAENRCVGVE